jgi:DNA ligase-1
VAELEDGDEVEVQGSTSTYTLKRLGSVYSCSCPAWKNQGATLDKRTCKHLRGYLGDAVETARIGVARPDARRGESGGSAAGEGTGKSPGEAKAPPLLLAHKWETDHDPTGWWMSEKLDGIRAYWDGETLTSRLGNRFYAPDWFVADLPADTLDGELWVGRKQFQRTTSIVRSGAASLEWKQVTYVVFDVPNAKGGFEDRIAHAQKVMARAEAPHARWHEHVRCDGVVHLREELAKVEALGGEGLMLRRPGSRYEVGRSASLLKVKTFHDAEARVIGHAPGTGKHKGRLGALVVELPDGVTFNVGTGFSDAEREKPPAMGAVITFRYQELSNDGVPRFPSYVGERVDVELPARVKSAKPARKPDPEPEPASDTDTDADADADADSAAADYFVRLEHPTEHKFWEIEVRGKEYFIRFGKLGSPGQTRVTDLGSATAAKTDAEKRAAQKRREGYENVRRK